MQSNTITISETGYDRFQEYPDRSVYIHPSHTIGRNRLFSLSRVVPTTEGATARVRVKFARDIVQDVTGVKGTIYTTLEVSRPVWATDASVSEDSASVAALMLLPEYQQLLHKQSI